MTGGGVTGGGVLSAELGVPDAFDGALAFDPQTLNLMLGVLASSRSSGSHEGLSFGQSASTVQGVTQSKSTAPCWRSLSPALHVGLTFRQ